MYQTLAQRTRLYWMVSSKWNGQLPKGLKIPTAEALVTLRDIEDVTHVKKALNRRTSALTDQIIRGAKRKKPKGKSDAPIDMLTFEMKA